MERKFNIGDVVMCETASTDPYEIIDALWNPYFGCWTYNAKSLDAILLGATELSLVAWDVGNAPVGPKACDCGGRKARTSHSHWCSSLT